MFDKLNQAERMLLLKFVCAFAWADLEIQDGERKFVDRLMDRLELGDDDRAQVDEWLTVAPSPESVSAGKIPEEHKRLFLEAAQAMAYADGGVDPDERALLDRLKAGIGI